MADIFTKLGESIKTTVKEATEQTQKSIDQTIYRKELLEKKSELKGLYQQLGEAQYESYIENKQNISLTPFYTQITALLKEINKLQDQVKEIVNSQKDSFDTYKREVKTTWNENMAQEARPEKGEDGLEVMKICSECNTGNNVEASYCINCGKNF